VNEGFFGGVLARWGRSLEENRASFGFCDGSCELEWEMTLHSFESLKVQFGLAIDLLDSRGVCESSD
jgi:hypothetical protein